MGFLRRAVGKIFGYGDDSGGQNAAPKPSESQNRGDTPGAASPATGHRSSSESLLEDYADDPPMTIVDDGAPWPPQQSQDVDPNGDDDDGEAMDVDAEELPHHGRTDHIDEAHSMQDTYSEAPQATEWFRSDDEMDDDPGIIGQAPYDLKMDAVNAVLPAVKGVKCCSWLPALARRLQLQDLQTFRLPDHLKLPSKPPVHWRAVASHFLNLLKVGEPWMETMDHLQLIIRHPETEEPPTEDQVFMWLLSQSDEGVHRHLLALRMVRNPVPFIVGGAVMRNVGASMPNTPLLASVKFGETVLGASTLVNETFQTKFEEHDEESKRTKGYAQIHFPMDYKESGRGFAVADVHGGVDSKVRSVVARHAQALLLHVDSARLEESNMVADVLQLCRASSGAKPVVVLLRDYPGANKCKPCKPAPLADLPPGVLVLALPRLSSAGDRKREQVASDLRKVLIQAQHLGLALGGSNISGNFSKACGSRPPSIKPMLQCKDVKSFRSLELDELCTANWEAIARHLAVGLMEDSQLWAKTVERLHHSIANPQTAERATEEQLFIWLLSQSEESLQQLLLSQRMARSPVPFIVNGAVFHNLYPCMPETPFLLSVKFDKRPLGASTLLDKMFGTSFAEHAQEYSSTSASVHVQLARMGEENCQRVAVADAHGKMDRQLLSAMAPRAQAVLLHVDSALPNDENMVSEVVEICSALSSVSKPVIALLRDHPQLRQPKIFRPGLEPIFPLEAWLAVALPNYAGADQQLARDASELRKVLMQPHYLGAVLGEAQEAPGTFSRSSLRALLGDDGTDTPEEVDEVIQAIVADPESVGKLEKAHIARCEQSKKINKSNVQEDHATMLKCYEAEKVEKSHLQRLCLDGQHKPIAGFIRCLRHDDAAAQLQELQKRLLQKKLSPLIVNTLFKELYLLMEEKELTGSLAEDGPVALAEYIWAGNPFEILDGDNLHLHRGSLGKAFLILDHRLRKEGLTLHVESSIGPQSAGKSTLNNCKYGCRFNVSEGRCTRGIYGQLVRMDKVALLILDTEGLDSAQKQDWSRQSDQVMTLLILATSHHIDFVIKGNMTENMKSLIQVCIRAAEELETVAKIPSPNLHWIFNQVADPNKRHHEECLEITNREILEAFENDGTRTQQKIRIRKDNIDVVPAMLKELVALLGDEKTWVKLDIAVEFSQQVRKMGRMAVEQREERMRQPAPAGEQKPLLLSDWLVFLADVLRTIQSFPDLTHFQDIKQVRLESELRKWISDMLKQRFQVHEGLKEEQAKIEEWCTSPCLHNAEQLLDHHFEELWKNFKEMLEKRCAELGCDANLASRMEVILRNQHAARRSSWQTQLARHYQDAEVKRACMDGHSEIRKLIRDFLKQPQAQRERLTDDDLRNVFDARWQRIIDSMAGKFKFDEFAHKLLRSMREVSGHPSRPSQQVLDRRLACDSSAQESQVWITRDGHRPGQPWKTPAEGAPWKRFFRNAFLAAMDPPVGDEAMRDAEEDEPMMPQDADLQDARKGVASRMRRVGKRSPPLLSAEARKRQRPSPLVEHLRDPSRSRLNNEQLIEEIEREKVINWRLAFKELMDEVSNLVDPARQPDINLVQSVDQAATSIIDDVNRALMAIGCNLTSDGKGEFVMRALIKAWNLVKQNHYETYMQPIEDFKMKKGEQQEFFIASVKQDIHSDTIIASKLAREVIEVISTDVLKEAEVLQKKAIENNRPKLSREVLQEQVDACFGTEDLDAQEKAIRRPAEVVRARFDAVFDEHVRREADMEVSRCFWKVESQLQGLSRQADHLRRLPGMEPEHTMSDQVFVLGDSHSGGPAVTRKAKRWAASQWLCYVLVNNADKLRQWEIPDLWGAGKLDVSVCEGKLPAHRVVDGDTLYDMKDAVRRALEQTEDDDGGIGCIHAALAKMAETFAEAYPQIKEKLKPRLEKQLDSMRAELRAAVVPCLATCPCCARMCDNEEPAGKDVPHVHRCSSGHQCRGFMGVFLDDGKRTASTRICSQVKDDDNYMDENGIEWKWSDFKKAHPEWDFSDRYDERAAELQARSLSAWKKVGPRFCEQYRIRFTPLGEEQTLISKLPVHYVLVLDSSSSMGAGGWSALHDAVSTFLQVRSQMESTKEDRISAVAFSAPCAEHAGHKRLMWYEELDKAQANWNTMNEYEKSTVLPKGRTDFVIAMVGAVELMKACAHNMHHRVQLIFMSDGADNEGTGLEDAIQELKDAVGDRPFSAVTLGFGKNTNFGRLNEVAGLLGGEYAEGLSDHALKEKFVEVAQRVVR